MEKLNTHSIIQEEDYLKYYMYTISTTEAFNKQRKRMKIILIIFVLVAAAWSIYNEAQQGSVTTIIILWIILLPAIYFLFKYLEKRKYTRFFKKYIATNHQENMMKGHDLIFTENELTIKFIEHDLEMPYSDIIEIYQNQNGIYIKNKNESSFIFPKGDTDFSKIALILEEASEKYNIPYQKTENWVWK